MDKFAKAIVFLLLRSNLSVKESLNMFGFLVLLFSVFIKIVSILYILFIRWSYIVSDIFLELSKE